MVTYNGILCGIFHKSCYVLLQKISDMLSEKKSKVHVLVHWGYHAKVPETR